MSLRAKRSSLIWCNCLKSRDYFLTSFLLGRSARLEPFCGESVESPIVERLKAELLADKSRRGLAMTNYKAFYETINIDASEY